MRTLEASEAHVLQHATEAADTAVGNVVENHAKILNRDIRTKSLNLDPQGTATKNFSMGEQYHIVVLPDPTVDHKAVNLRTLNRKVLNEIEVNNLLEAQKDLRLDGQNQMVSDLQINDHKIVVFADAVAPTDGVNKKILDAAVNSLRQWFLTGVHVPLGGTKHRNRGYEAPTFLGIHALKILKMCCRLL